MPALKPRLTACALTVAGALLLPVAGQAAVTFGSPLRNDPSTSGCNAACTIVAAVEPAFDPQATPVATGAPIDGVITAFQLREKATAQTQVTFRLADITVQPGVDPNPPTAVATAVATGPTIPVGPNPDDAQTIAVPARVPVKRGQHLAIDATPDLQAIYATDGSKDSYVFEPPLVDGQGMRGSSSVNEQLLVQATIEPDADRDGFGDETQDQCPADPRAHVAPCPLPQGPPPPHDTTPPAIHGLTIAAGRIVYSLSEASTVGVRIDRATSGRRVHRACVPATAKNRRAPRCTRFATLLRSARAPGTAGAHRLALPRPHGRKLGRGTYRLTLTARDAAGNATTIAKQFRI